MLVFLFASWQRFLSEMDDFLRNLFPDPVQKMDYDMDLNPTLACVTILKKHLSHPFTSENRSKMEIQGLVTIRRFSSQNMIPPFNDIRHLSVQARKQFSKSL